MRVLRYLWFNLVMLLTDWMPDLTSVLRLGGFLARPAFRRCGPGFQLARRVTVNFPDHLEIGRDVYLATGTWIHAPGTVLIEDEVQLAPYVVLISGDHGLKDGSYRWGSGGRAPIRLGRGCWVAAHATVTKGVTIGRGTLLAANAVATKDLPDYCIAGGVPAKVLRENVYTEEAPS